MMAQFGSIILRYDSVASTNDVARELAASDAVEGLCIIAREQTAGRGRQGRLWSSPPGEGLYLSLVLRPQIKAADSAMVTLAAAVGVAETFRLDFELPADIKWPNDVLVSDRKICGILVESAIQNDQLQYAVMGIGVNIGQASFPEDLGNSATSLLIETGRRIEPEDFALPMFERLEYWYSTVINHPDSVIQRWQELSSYARGCRVGVKSPEGTIKGTTRGLTSRGALILEMDDGEIREVVSGEVSLRAVSAAR